MDMRDVVWLLEDLCVTQGLCLSPVDQERLREAPPATPEAFAAAVVRAEGLDPAMNEELYRRVLATVERAFRRSAERDG